MAEVNFMNYVASNYRHARNSNDHQYLPNKLNGPWPNIGFLETAGQRGCSYGERKRITITSDIIH